MFAYDVTESIDRREGAENRLSAFVAPTWWCHYVCTARPWRTYPWKLGKNVAFNARLTLTFEDGTTRDVLTDENWSAAYSGPVRFADLYHGEVYDARLRPAFENPAALGTPEVNDEFKGEILPTRGAEVGLRRDLAMKPVRAYVWKDVTGAGADAFGNAGSLCHGWSAIPVYIYGAHPELR